jgi:cytochrome b
MSAEARRLEKQLIWDWPVRLAHWLLVFCFAGAWISAESERWRLVHITFGYTMLGLVAFRLMWGLVGTRHARFASFVRGPVAILRYAGSLLMLRPRPYAGHNPVGALAIIILLGLIVITTGAGHLVYENLAGDWAEEMHEAAAGVMLGMVIVHVVGVIATSFLHRENLVKAMITGRKAAEPGAAIRWSFLWLGVVMVTLVLGFWWAQWQSAMEIRNAASRLVIMRPSGYNKTDL